MSESRKGAQGSSLEEIFLSLLELGDEERSRALDALKTTDAELAERVKELLSADALNRDGALGATHEDEETPVSVGTYEIRRLVGQGGMGCVYDALHPGTGRRCALKLLQPGFSTKQNLQRFRREAEVLGRLDHKGIARVYDAGSAETVYSHGERSQRPYIAMEFVAGVDALTYTRGKNSTLNECAELIATAAEALQHAHECGIIHRDIKPANVMVDPSGAVKVVDFGIAQLAQDSDQSTTGLMPGTASYMSPEQLAGMRNRIGTRTDVYGLGATLFALVTGAHPPMSVATPHMEIPWRTGKPDRRLNAILRKAMALAPENRYSSAGHLAEELHSWSAGGPIQARPDPFDWFRKLRRNSPRTFYTAATCCLVLGVFAVRPEWRTYVHARLVPARAHSVIVLDFGNSSESSVVAEKLNDWAAEELRVGGLLIPVDPANTPHGVLQTGSSELLSQEQVIKIRKAGAEYAVAGDFELSGEQPWATLQLHARLIDTATGRTVDIASAQGSLAEAQGLIAEICLQLSQAIGGPEQLVRLRHKADPETDQLLRDGIDLLAGQDFVKARVLLGRALNRNYSRADTRLALARALDELGYREVAHAQAAVAESFADNAEQRADAQALQYELDGNAEEALRKRESVKLEANPRESWMSRASEAADLLALHRMPAAEELIAAGLSAPDSTPSERFKWRLIETMRLRMTSGRPGEFELANSLVDEARREGSGMKLAVALVNLSNALTYAGKQDESVAVLKQANDLYSSGGDRQGRISVVCVIGQRLQIHGNNQESIDLLSAAMRDVAGTGFVQSERQVAILLGAAYGRGFDPELSRKLLSRALVLSWTDTDKRRTREVLLRLGITFRDEGNLQEARRLLTLAIPPVNERGESAGRAFNALGEAEVMAGNADSALDDAKQATKLAGSDEDVTMDALAVRTRALALKGDYTQLDASFGKVREVAVRRGMWGSLGLVEQQWGECLLWRGQPRAAIAHLRKAEEEFRRIVRPAYQAYSDSLLASAEIDSGDLTSAKASLQRAASISSVGQFAYSRLAFALANAQLAEAQRDRQTAIRDFQSVNDDALHLGFAPEARAAETALKHLHS